jgi:predicted transcriptional regulator
MKRIVDYLQQLGLSDIEAQLYKGLLEAGSTTIMDLANHVNMKRITVHFNIENLMKKALISRHVKLLHHGRTARKTMQYGGKNESTC